MAPLILLSAFFSYHEVGCSHMSLLHRSRELLRYAGLDVSRFPNPASVEARRVAILKANNVDLVLDVGASSGRYGLELRRHGYVGDILSFEPQPSPYERLAKRCSSDEKWTARQEAVGRSTDPIDLNISANGDSSSVLPMLQAHVDAAPESHYVAVRAVNQTTISLILPSLSCDRPFLKMDVQGYERAVIEGASLVIDRLVGIQMEMSLEPLYQEQMLYQEALQLMEDHGFVLWSIEPGFSHPSSGRLLQMDGLFMRME